MMLPSLLPYTFEWDEAKNQLNQTKHKVSFEEAQYAFLDPDRCITIDENHSFETEQRYYCIGMINGRICTVRYTLRNNHIRIIGAGYWRKEQAIYEKTHY